MDRGEAAAIAGTCCPVTSDIHAALGIVPAAGREAVEPALVNRHGLFCDLRRARAIRNHHRACDQQPKGFIHGTGPVPGLGPSLYGPLLPIPSTEQKFQTANTGAPGGWWPTTPV